jgi:SNF family Na+-dependent transporter
LDRFANNIVLPISALFCIALIVFKFGVRESQKEYLEGAAHKTNFLATIYPWAIRIVAPLAILAILAHSVGLF